MHKCIIECTNVLPVHQCSNPCSVASIYILMLQLMYVCMCLVKVFPDVLLLHKPGLLSANSSEDTKLEAKISILSLVGNLPYVILLRTSYVGGPLMGLLLLFIWCFYCKNGSTYCVLSCFHSGNWYNTLSRDLLRSGPAQPQLKKTELSDL